MPLRCASIEQFGRRLRAQPLEAQGGEASVDPQRRMSRANGGNHGQCLAVQRRAMNASAQGWGGRAIERHRRSGSLTLASAVSRGAERQPTQYHAGLG